MAGMSVPTPTLDTARLRLRPFTDLDADRLFALQSDAHVLRYWDAPPWTDRARADRFIEACRVMAEEGSGARLAVDRLSDGAFIGWCSLTRWNPVFRSASLGYCLGEAAWGQGYATEAARALLEWSFDTWDLNRVQAETDTRNLASAHVLEKLGFLREGTLREDCVVNGEVSDSWVYGLLRRQWRAGSPWTALELIGGAPTTRASTGYPDRAAGVQELVRAAHGYLRSGLGTDFEPLLIVADQADWALAGDEAPPYGIPYASDTELDLVLPADLSDNFLVDTYAAFGPRQAAERLADLIAVHELGHLHVRELGLDLPQGWLGEFLATYLSYCFLSAHRPDDAATWLSLSREALAAVTPVHRSLEVLDELYFGVGPDNYIWYQNQLTVMVDRVHAELGIDFVLRLRSAGLGPDSDGPSMLAAAAGIYPGFESWAAGLRD